MVYNPWHPPPVPPGFGTGKTLPEVSASPLSKLVFSWLDSILWAGFTRPLEKDDLYTLPKVRLVETLTDAVQHNFYTRCAPEQQPLFMREGRIDPLKRTNTSKSGKSAKSGKSGKSTRKSNAESPLDEKRAAAAEEEEEEDEEKKLDASTSEETTDPEKGSSGVGVDDTLLTVEGENPAFIKRLLTRKRPVPAADGKTKFDASLLAAIHRTFFWRWWSAGVLYAIASTLNTTTPLVNKALLSWLSDAYAYYQLGPSLASAELHIAKPRGMGYGIGLAFAVFIMQEASSLMTHHYFLRMMISGLSIRSAVIGNIFRKSMRLSGKSRVEHSIGKITTMISTDATRLDFSCMMAHNIWIAPIQIIIGIGLLIWNLGYSALVGLALLVLMFPIQFVLVRSMFRQRKKAVGFTDVRVRTLTEILSGVRLIKYYAWEAWQGERVGGVRKSEVRAIRRMALMRATLISMVTMMPVLAAVLSFITYSLTGHDLNVAIIFSSLQFFNIIRQPLMLFPMVVSTCSDAVVALGRISKFLLAEELEKPFRIEHNPEYKFAVEVDGASFAWESTKDAFEKSTGTGGPAAGGPGGKGGRGGKGGKGKGGKGKKEKKAKKGKGGTESLPTSMPGSGTTSTRPSVDEKPFELNDVRFKVPKGSFVAIVGKVGSGKSSLLQALIGEMRRTAGEVIFGGSVAYVPQTPWIMNATLRENVLFGREDDDTKFQEIVHACCLTQDLAMLPHGDATEIGEKGINLSGGQKARVSLARAAYSDCDLILLDDPLSAVDAHVGNALVQDCLLDGPLAGKTRVLVTHQLHALDKVDYVYVMEGGKIIEEGTYDKLRSDGRTFAHLIEEFGNLEKEKEEEDEEEEEERLRQKKDAAALAKDKSVSLQAAAKKDPSAPGLMQEEERNRGAVTWTTYGGYLRHAGGAPMALTVFFSLVLMQCANVANNLFLGFWTAESIHGFGQAEYMATYAGLGIALAVFSWASSFSISIMCLRAGLSLFRGALKGVLHSSIPDFFDTTPTGRIMSRLSKDQDTLDTQLPMTLFQLLFTLFQVFGTIALVFYAFPLLGIIFVPLFLAYFIVATFYRRTSVETKRLDSLLRSALYASYTETLTGLATVRAYREQGRFIHEAENGLNGENRAYYITIAIQRWLGVRLDVLGNCLILGLCLFAVGFRNTTNPAKIGVVLSYTLGITQTFSQMVSQYAQQEQDMNAVERVLVYNELPPEGPATTPDDPPASWPENGEVQFRNVELAYRKGLPLVLKDVSIEIRAGEKVGIVGRTGAGKSSLLQALFRIVNLHSGKIEIDGVNISNIGLDVLRSRLALVPQDSTLFLGTLRSNLDPQGKLTDAELIQVLQRAWLLPKDGTDPVAEAKFGLDAKISDEGGNYSAGEKQLLALCRALVKNSKIIVLDEATSSVDVETDAKLQRTIQTEFASSTLLCIAHRLNTIVYYDRILVMDNGKVAEFDAPLSLFDQETSIFRSLCDEAGLTREDIVRIRQGGAVVAAAIETTPISA